MWIPTLLGIGLLWWMAKRGAAQVGTTERVAQLPGTAGIVQTVGLMKSMVNQAIDSPVIRKQAARVTEGIDRGNYKAQAVALGAWVRRAIRYVPDPRNLEHLTNPAIFAQAVEEKRRVYGDCDDMSMYVAALAKSIGLRPVFKVVGRGKQYHHVYVEVNGIPIDPTVEFGVKPFTAHRTLSLEV